MKLFLDSGDFTAERILQRVRQAIDAREQLTEQDLIQTMIQSLTKAYVSHADQLQITGDWQTPSSGDDLLMYEWWVHSQRAQEWIGFSVGIVAIMSSLQDTQAYPVLIQRDQLWTLIQTAQKRHTLPLVMYLNPFPNVYSEQWFVVPPVELLRFLDDRGDDTWLGPELPGTEYFIDFMDPEVSGTHALPVTEQLHEAHRTYSGIDEDMQFSFPAGSELAEGQGRWQTLPPSKHELRRIIQRVDDEQLFERRDSSS